MNILVAGGAGYIGSVTSRRLRAAGHRVVVYDNFVRGHREAITAGCTLVEGDLADRARIIAACREHAIDAAFHFAALIEVGESVADPRRYWSNNVIGSMELIDALMEAGVRRIVFSSTAATYGEPDRLPIDETHPKKPTNPYGATKLAIEFLLESYRAAYGLQFVALRYFNAAGAEDGLGEDHTPETHLVPLVLRVALGQRRDISVFGSDWPTPDGTCIRDYVHVGDIAAAHLAALDRMIGDPTFCGAYNLGNGEGYSVLQVIETAREITGHAIPAVMAPRRAGDPAILVAASARARQDLGWSPRVPLLSDIVASAWEWHRAHPQGYRSTADAASQS